MSPVISGEDPVGPAGEHEPAGESLAGAALPVLAAPPNGIPRRQVLGWMAAGVAIPWARAWKLFGGTTSGRQALSQALPDPAIGALPDTAIKRGVPTPTYTASVTRREDMCNLSFEFYNLGLANGELVPSDPSATSYVVVVFPPQHVGEEAVDFTATPPWPAPPLEAALAGPTRLVFQLPVGSSLPFTAQSLLSLSSLTPVLAPTAVSPTNSPAAPTNLETYIEAPWDLFLSPLAAGTWHNPTAPVTANGNTEIWQTRLGQGALEPPTVKPAVKAIWTPGYPGNPLPSPFLLSLTGTQRAQIVTRTCGFNFAGVPPVPAQPAAANLMLLTALGASLNVQGNWAPAAADNLVEWVHRTSIGRDSYVRVVEFGFLFPFGHQAVRVTITDREFQADPNAEVIAYLVQKSFIVVVQPRLGYDGNAGEPNAGRQNPLRVVEVKTITSPPFVSDKTIDPDIVIGSFSTDDVLWVRAGGSDISFAHVATDLEGRRVDFSTGVIWASSTIVESAANVADIITAYEGAVQPRRMPSFGGGLLAFAEVESTNPGVTAQHVDSYELDAIKTLKPGGLQPGFFPVMKSADIRLPAAEQVAGPGSPVNPPNVSYYPHFVTNGFTPGAPEIYLMVNGSSTDIAVPPKLSGGSATPSLTVQGIARDLGPVGGSGPSDLDNLLGGNFDPSSFFSSASKLLGAISLADIIEKVTGDTSKTKDQSPKLNAKPIYPNNNSSLAPTAIEVTLDWSPSVTEDSLGFFVPDSNGSLTVHVDITTPFANPANVTYNINGALSNFALQLFGNAAPYIQVHFTSLAFKFSTGAKIDITPKIDKVTFEGPLTFIQDIEQLLASLGGPSIDIEPSGITASYSLPLPDVGVGVLDLQNLKLGAGLTIPFDGTPVRVRFDLCTRDDPFILTISLFGGGGFFGLAIGADGIELIEVSLEFGAALSIDLGVASGGVSIMAGIYFSLQTAPTKQVQLTGFLKADGNLEVLGIISISMEFYLGFTYLDPGKAYGEATVTLTISILFFSATVSATMRKTLGGSGDPTFGQALTQAEWDQYCSAFAA